MTTLRGGVSGTEDEKIQGSEGEVLDSHWEQH